MNLEIMFPLKLERSNIDLALNKYILGESKGLGIVIIFNKKFKV